MGPKHRHKLNVEVGVAVLETLADLSLQRCEHHGPESVQSTLQVRKAHRHGKVVKLSSSELSSDQEKSQEPPLV